MFAFQLLSEIIQEVVEQFKVKLLNILNKTFHLIKEIIQ
jgi:hypothetical protein